MRCFIWRCHTDEDVAVLRATLANLGVEVLDRSDACHVVPEGGLQHAAMWEASSQVGAWLTRIEEAAR